MSLPLPFSLTSQHVSSPERQTGDDGRDQLPGFADAINRPTRSVLSTGKHLHRPELAD
jgi:hypothetical protein